MSNILIDPCSVDINDLIDVVWRCSGYTKPIYSSLTSSVFINNTIANANIIYRAIYNESFVPGVFQNQRYDKVEAVYTPTSNRRICLVRVPVKLVNHYDTGTSTGYEILHYLPVSNVQNIYSDFSYAPYRHVANATRTVQDMTGWVNYQLQTVESPYGQLSLVNFNSAQIDEFNSYNNITSADNVANLKAIANGKNYYFAYTRDGDTRYGSGLNIIPSYMYGGCYAYEKLPDTIPVFDVDQVSNIRAFLDSGDDSGKKDPFDPNNPSIIKVTDYKTNFKVSLTPTSAKNGVKVSVIAYNAQYIAGGDNVAGTCCLHGESKLGTETSYNGIGNNSLPKYPQITKTFDLIVDSSSNRWIYFVFRNVDDVNSHSSWFGVDLIYSDKSATHCKIALVTGGDAINSGSSCTRSSITDGYRYTRTATGEYVDVVFRAFDMDDLNDPYNDDDDTENTESGSDVDSGVGGKGLRTYAISNTQFENINTALWSTDWTTVFKSNTINPLNCVMACKSIPFTASAISGGVVTIANLNTNVSANYVTPIKTFSCGSLSLDKYNKDFTDLTHTKVRVYMPYIGWRELPAIEVIGRVAVPKCGLVAHNKTLAFKYIVDFVDGNCRCVISVNGTERYYFDGNCSIDVPVTSDNHTTAVGNAIKAGVQTVMSIGAGVASGVAGNAVGAVGGAISALQSAPNVIPTYQYSATTSPSGYIDASMPQKIIIVIERPVYTVPDNYAHTAGRPCALTLSLGSLTGYTKCANVDISGVSGSDRQRSEVKQLLESGVYL